MDKPNLNTYSRDELLTLYASATAKLSQIAEAVSSETGPPVFTLKGRRCGQTTALVLKLTEENVANSAKLAAVLSILDGHDMAESEWERCQAIAGLPDVDAALLAFADDPTGDQAVMIVRAVLRAIPPPVEREEQEAVGEIIQVDERRFISMEDDTLNSLPVGTKLYTTPQPASAAQNVAVLVEALKRVYLTRDERLRAGSLCAAHWDNAVVACIEVVEKHFANHQSGGANS